VITDPSSSPPAFFAAEIKQKRGIAGITQEQLARATSYSPASVAAIETCRLIPSREFSEQADRTFNTDGILSRLQALVETSSVLPWFRDLVETERKAASIQNYESYIMPGLLQTESYARCAVSAIRPRLSDDEVERAVILRMSRQEILERDDPPRLWAIIEESVLRRQVGSREVMREQCDHLITMGSRPHIAIQVIPDTRGITASYGQAYMVLTFPGKQPPLAYLEDARSARYVRERDEVGTYSIMFDYLRSSALDDEESSAMIRSYSNGYSA
jgi:transcriptional regulator with XRE-family HTH domain